MKVSLFTIGFAETSAERFFTALQKAGVQRVIDVRLSNTSQLAGFSKKADLRYFLNAIAGIDYLHMPELAPSQALFDAYKKQKGAWEALEQGFNKLIAARQIETVISKQTAHLGCLLCSERAPEHCHRRLVAEYLQAHWPNLRVTHLVP